MNKYKLTNNIKKINEKILYQIEALINIEELAIVAGDLGGFVEMELNLSQDGDAWVSGDAWVRKYVETHDPPNIYICMAFGNLFGLLFGAFVLLLFIKWPKYTQHSRNKGAALVCRA